LTTAFVLVAALVLVVAAAGAWWLGRRRYEAFNRILAKTDRLRVASAELESTLRAETIAVVQNTRSALDGLRREVVAAGRATSKNSADTLALTRRADEVQSLVQQLDDTIDRQQALATCLNLQGEGSHGISNRNQFLPGRNTGAAGGNGHQLHIPASRYYRCRDRGDFPMGIRRDFLGQGYLRRFYNGREGVA